MKINDQQFGTPQALYKGTQAAIEALTGAPEGAVAYATDLNQLGTYDGATWTWGGGGGAVDSVNGQTGVVVLTAGDVGAQASFTVLEWDGIPLWTPSTAYAVGDKALFQPDPVTPGSWRAFMICKTAHTSGADVWDDPEKWDLGVAYQVPFIYGVTGDGVNNIDPSNPILTFPTPGEIGAATAAQGSLADTALQTDDLMDQLKTDVQALTLTPPSSAPYDRFFFLKYVTGTWNWVYTSLAGFTSYLATVFAGVSHDHTEAFGDSGIQLDHGTAMTSASLLDDDHPQYAQKQAYSNYFMTMGA